MADIPQRVDRLEESPQLPSLGGGRYLSLVGGNHWFHHPDDRWPHTIDLDKTERVTRAVLAVAGALARRA